LGLVGRAVEKKPHLQVSHYFVQYPQYHPSADSGVGYDDQMVRALHLMVASSIREREPFPDVQSWELQEADVPF
jgi:hypothetical protein